MYVFWEVLRFLPSMYRGQNWYLPIATMEGGDHENYNYQWGGGDNWSITEPSGRIRKYLL